MIFILNLSPVVSKEIYFWWIDYVIIKHKRICTKFNYILGIFLTPEISNANDKSLSLALLSQIISWKSALIIPEIRIEPKVEMENWKTFLKSLFNQTITSYIHIEDGTGSLKIILLTLSASSTSLALSSAGIPHCSYKIIKWRVCSTSKSISIFLC